MGKHLVKNTLFNILNLINQLYYFELIIPNCF